MAITAYTGPPGAGKSHALVAQVIVPAVIAGRRVLTNIEGVQPDRVVAHAILKGADPDKVGSVVLFDGADSTKSGFWPTQEISDADTFVKGGDLIVFDEWKLYWPRRGKLPTPDLEAFLRWHRHLTDEGGQSCDVVIASQIASDIHSDFRALIQRSYKFRKLDSVGASKAYVYHVFDGHLQPKGGSYVVGNGRYDPEIFGLYKSYSTTGQGQEKATDARGSIWNRSVAIMAAVCVLMLGFGGWGAYRFFSGGALGAKKPAQASAAQPLIGSDGMPAIPKPAAPAKSKGRIMGRVLLPDGGERVVITDAGGAVRFEAPTDFTYSADGRPIRGTLDGEQVFAEDRPAAAAPPMFGGFNQ